MKSVSLALIVSLLFGVIFCEDEPCVQENGCLEETIVPEWVGEMNAVFAKKSLEVKVKEIVKIERRRTGNGGDANAKAQIVAEDGRTCTVTWTESEGHADDWIPEMNVDCK